MGKEQMRKDLGCIQEKLGSYKHILMFSVGSIQILDEVNFKSVALKLKFFLSFTGRA